MTVPPDQPLKPKMTAEDCRIRQRDRIATIRLRMAIGRALDKHGISTPAETGAALGLAAAEAVKLLTGRVLREDGVALLEAAAARLGVKVSHQ